MAYDGWAVWRTDSWAAWRGSWRLLILLLGCPGAEDNRRVPDDEIEIEAGGAVEPPPAPATAAARPSAGWPGTRCHGPGGIGDPVGPGADVEPGGDAG